MHLSAGCVFVFAFVMAMASADSTDSFLCRNKYCFITKNSQNEQVLNCTTGEVKDDFIRCLYFRNNFKIMLLTKNETYVKIDRVAPGAFQRLASKMIVKKVFMQKIILPQLDSRDFEGLSKITEMHLENPKVLAHDTFVKLASKRDVFVLQISCNEVNRNNSFKELHFRGVFWMLHTYGCQNSVICETTTCNVSNEYPLYKLISTNQTSSPKFRLGYNQCKEMPNCAQTEKNKVTAQNTLPPKPTQSAVVTANPKSKSAKLVTTPKSDNYYDTLMWVVLWLTGINSIVIMGILIFLIIWLKRMSTSAANKKHTIILEDEDNTKYLKLTPYA